MEKKAIPETFTSYFQKYYYKNRKVICKRQIEYVKKNPEIRRKTNRINNWKTIGIIDTDWDLLYEEYIKTTHCWICSREFTSSRIRHLDHDHKTGEPRYICCVGCNTRLLSEYWNPIQNP